MSRRSELKYPLLIAEDKPDDLRFYREGIKRACRGELWLNFMECEAARDAREYITATVCPFFSFDQNMPDQPRGQVKEDEGVELAELALKMNPLSIVTLLTAFPKWRPAHMAGKQGVDYVSKQEVTASGYGRQLVKRILAFERKQAWEIALQYLPPILGPFCKHLSFEKDANRLKRQSDALSLWETGIRLLALTQIAMLDFLNSRADKVCRMLTGRLGNDSLLRAIETSILILDDVFTENDLSFQGREHRRFFRDSQYQVAARDIQLIRNLWAHSPHKETDDLVSDNLHSFFTFLLTLSFWIIHPLVKGLVVVPWGKRNALRGTLFRSEDSACSNQTWKWDRSRELLVHPDHLYQVIVNPEKQEEVLVVPLFPLLRLELKGTKTCIWLAHNPLRNQYRNPLDGDIKAFDDNKLVQWWKKRTEDSSATTLVRGKLVGRKSSKEELEKDTEPQSPVERWIPLAEKIRAHLKAYYLPEGILSLEEEDTEYQANFDGVPKAKRVLEYLSTACDFPPEKLAYVSIGGADGSELAFVLENSRLRYGILVEFSDCGAAMARKHRDALSTKGKELVVLQGDAMQRLEGCADKLREWKRVGFVDGVVLSMQSVVHELPYRSPGFDINVLLGRIFEPFDLRIFHSREPAKPMGWPSPVHLRIQGIPGHVLWAISSHINDVFGFSDRVENLADNYVQMSSDLAVETLFKILYCSDSERYRYEMGERLTAFDPQNFCRILGNYITVQENIEFQYLITETFRTRYKAIGVQARSATGENLGMPQAFVRITGYQKGPK